MTWIRNTCSLHITSSGGLTLVDKSKLSERRKDKEGQWWEWGRRGKRKGEAVQAEQWDVDKNQSMEKKMEGEGSASGPEALTRGWLWQKRERNRREKLCDLQSFRHEHFERIAAHFLYQLDSIWVCIDTSGRYFSEVNVETLTHMFL